MAAYLIADIVWHDAERYKEIEQAVPALIEKHGGKYIVRGGDPSVIEGDWSPLRLIVVEFPDREAFLAFYNDPEYEPYKTLRQSISDSKLVIVDHA